MIQTRIAGGVFWSIFMRWSMKGIGLINTIILARILTPEDFGILAMAAIFIALIEEMSTINVSLLLIRTTKNTKEHNDCAWTVSIVQGMIIAPLMILLAPAAAYYFNDNRVIDVIYVLALLKLVFSFRNVGLIIARKELQFSFDFRFMIYARLIRFSFVLILALILRSYWAMVLGSLGAEIIAVILSYIMHPYRPRICFKYFAEYLKFAITMIPMAVAKLLNNKFDVVIVGGTAGATLMGVYNVSNELSSIFTKEIVTPASRGLFPNLSRLTSDRTLFISIYKKLVHTAIAICIPIGAGIWVSADDLVISLLGDKWLKSTIYLKWLGVYGAFESITFILSEHPLIALGLERRVNALMWLRFIIRALCVLVGYLLLDILGIAVGMAASAVLSFVIVSLLVFRDLGIDYLEITKKLFSPIASTVGMILAITSLAPIVTSYPALVILLLKISLGIFVYTALTFLIWILAGKPNGLEKTLVDYAIGALNRKRT